MVLIKVQMLQVADMDVTARAIPYSMYMQVEMAAICCCQSADVVFQSVVYYSV